MGLKEKMERFNQRWNIPNNSITQPFIEFKTRVLNVFKGIDSHINRRSISLFCQYYGIEEQWESQPFGDHEWSLNIQRRLISEDNQIEFFRLIEVIFSLEITTTAGYDRQNTYSKDILFSKILEAINFSKVNLSATKTVDGEFVFYPSGEALLDEALVNSVLSFLTGNSSKHFIDALNFYQDSDYIKSAESIRRSLEEFLRIKLNNSRGLKDNTTEIGKKLKTDGNSAQVRNIIFQVFGCLDQYFNEECKHNDGDIDEPENEFLIYQAALLMRYVEKIIK